MHLRHCDECHHEFLGKDGSLCDWCNSSSYPLPAYMLSEAKPVKECQVLVSIWYRGMRSVFLTTGIQKEDGSVSITNNFLEKLLEKSGIYPATAYSIGS